MRIPFLSFFKASPFGDMEEHSQKVKDYAWTFQQAFECLINDTCEDFDEHRHEILKIETEANAVKRRIRGHIPKNILVPVNKLQVLMYLKKQDDILVGIKDALEWLSYRGDSEFPQSVKKDFYLLVDASIEPIEELSKFIPARDEQLDITIASREAPGSVRYNEPEYRHLGGRLINFAIRLLILPGFHDTQCGFKLFHKAVAEEIFSYQTLSGWSFDIEILYIALKRGYQVDEVPIHWYFDSETKLRAVNDALRMLRDIFLIHWNNLRGLYDPRD